MEQQLSRDTLHNKASGVAKWPRGLERLEAAVIDAKYRLAALNDKDPSATQIALCDHLINEAEQAAFASRRRRDRPREYIAWDCLAQFDRYMVHSMDASERAPLWTSLLAEAEHKLNGHRKEAVLKHTKTHPATLDLESVWRSIKTEKEEMSNASGEEAAQSLMAAAKESVPSADLVCSVMKLLQTESQNSYHKIGQIKRQVDFVALLLLILVAGLLCSEGVRIYNGWSGDIDRAVLLGMLMGLIGGILSLTFTVIRSDAGRKIPTMRTQFEVALIRPLVGAVMALPVILILEAGVVSIPWADKNWVVALAGFLAGFSERWFLGLVEGLENRVS